MKKLNIFVLIIILISNLNTTNAQSTYDVNTLQNKKLNFGHLNKKHQGSTTGTSAGDITLYTNVATISNQRIDCIVTTISLNPAGSFHSSYTPPFDYHTNSSNVNGNDSSFFSPLFDFKSSGSPTRGSCLFEFQFISGGTYNSSTKKGTNVILQNVYVNTYDIDGNGTTNSNQFTEFGGFSESEIITGGEIQINYNPNTSLTTFSSKTKDNEQTVTHDNHRVRVFYKNISNFRIAVGGLGQAFFFIDFSPGTTAWSGTPTLTKSPVLDLNTITSGLNNSNTLSACNTHVNFTSGSTNISGVNSLVDNIYVQFDGSQIKDATNEILNINGGSGGANIALNFTTGGSLPQVTHNNITYNVTSSVTSGIRKLTFAKSSGTVTMVEAEGFIDALRYINTDCSPSYGERSFDVSIKEGSFESEKANFLIDVAISPPSLDLNKSTSGLNNISTLEACNTYATFTDGIGSSKLNLSGAKNIDHIYVQFDGSQIKDATNEILNINGGSGGANIALNFTTGGSLPQVTHNNITYNVTSSVTSGIRKLTFAKSSGTVTMAEAEGFIDAFRYINTDCGTLSYGERSFDVSIRQGSFESEKAKFLLDVAIPLPIDLVSYNAKRNNNIVDLTWTTFGDNKNPFNILKSTDGVNWKSIGTQIPSDNSVNYLFTDHQPAPVNYYQLSQIDNSNTLQYSDIRIVNFNSNKLVIFPNPNNGEFTIQSNHVVQFQISDFTGKVIMEGDNSIPLIKTNFNKGIYFIKITEDENTTLSKMIVQ